MALAIFSEERRKWLTLAAVSFGLLVIMLDNTLVNVALPSIQEDLTAAARMLIGGIARRRARPPGSWSGGRPAEARC